MPQRQHVITFMGAQLQRGLSQHQIPCVGTATPMRAVAIPDQIRWKSTTRPNTFENHRMQANQHPPASTTQSERHGWNKQKQIRPQTINLQSVKQQNEDAARDVTERRHHVCDREMFMAGTTCRNNFKQFMRSSLPRTPRSRYHTAEHLSTHRPCNRLAQQRKTKHGRRWANQQGSRKQRRSLEASAGI